MAQYGELPVYKATYDLLLAIQKLKSGVQGKTTSTIIPSSPGIYQPVLDNRPANPPFTEGDIVTLSASGNDSVAGFTVSAKTISKIETSQDTIQMSPGEDIHLKWKAAADPEDSRMLVVVDISYHGGTKAKIECDCLDDGELTIPAAMLDMLKTYGMAGYPKIEMYRTSTGICQNTAVQLIIQSYVVLWVKIPGLISCTMDGHTGNCPSGMTCDASMVCVTENE